MKSWEFLIQKHGKNAWFPLKKQKLKLPEGRYRIVAQCDRPNLEVEVRVTHHVKTTPRKRRSQQRQGRTNADGLMVIVPFVNFSPGLWEIRASSDIMSDLMGENWQKTVKLRVLAQNSELLAENTPATAPAVSQETTAREDFEISTEENGDSEAENPIEPVVESVSETISPENEEIPETADTPAELDWPVEGGDRESEDGDFAISEGENPIEPIVESVSETISPENDEIPETAATPAELDWPVEGRDRESEDRDFAISEGENPVSEPAETAITSNPVETRETSLSGAMFGEPDENIEPAATAETEDFVFSETETPQTEDRDIETTDLKSLLDQSIQSLEEILQQADRPSEIAETPETPPETPSQPEAVNPNEQWVEQMRDRVANLRLQLSLNYDNYVRYGTENLFVSGQVNAPANSSKDLNILLAPISDQNATLRLQYHLRDPQSTAFYDPDRPPENSQSQQVYHNKSANSESSLPLIFGFNLAIAPEFQQPLILGEAILELQIQAKQHEAVYTTILARQPFTITAALAELLETAFPRESAQPQTAKTVPPAPLKTDFVDLTKTPETVPVSQFNPKSKQAIPPKLGTAKSEVKGETPKRTLDLPPFNPPPEHSPFKTPEEPPTEPPETLETPEPPETPETEVQHPPIQFFAEADPNPTPEAVTGVWDEPLGSDLEADSGNLPDANLELDDFPELEREPEPPPNPTADRAFQSLQLQDRFWDRMNSLAEDASFFSTTWPQDDPPLTSDSEAEAITPEAPEEPLEAEAETEENPEDPENTESVVIPTPPPVQLPFEDLLAPPPPSRWARTPATDAELSEDSASPEETIDWDSDEEDTELEAAMAEPDTESPSSFFPTYPQTNPEEPEADAIASEVLFAETPPEPPSPAEAEYYNPEIVVDDDRDWYAPPPPRRDTSGLPYPDTVRVSAQEALGGVVRQDSTPIPIPILSVTEGELIAGEPVLIRIKLPPQSGAIYVKLWVIDCETRHLLDGPRALVDFSALPTGELETMTQLQVPLGSRSIRFEAIAIDIATQRESRKATADRSAIPPDLPDFSQDFF